MNGLSREISCQVRPDAALFPRNVLALVLLPLYLLYIVRWNALQKVSPLHGDVGCHPIFHLRLKEGRYPAGSRVSYLKT